MEETVNIRIWIKRVLTFYKLAGFRILIFSSFQHFFHQDQFDLACCAELPFTFVLADSRESKLLTENEKKLRDFETYSLIASVFHERQN